jgi:hypothetical protein
MPLVEDALGQDAGQIRQALSQLQMAFARMGGPAPEEEPKRPEPREPQPPQSGGQQRPQQPGGAQGPGGGRLWIPGQ